jgi:hypothetical protein
LEAFHRLAHRFDIYHAETVLDASFDLLHGSILGPLWQIIPGLLLPNKNSYCPLDDDLKPLKN